MTNRTFKGSQQQDAQEFLRCLLTQIHDEMGIQVPSLAEQGTRGCGQRESMMSCDSDVSGESQCSQSRLVGSTRSSPLIKKRSNSSSSLSRLKLTGSAHGSPASQFKFSKYSKVITSSSAKSSVESIPMVTGIQGAVSRSSLEQQEVGVEWEEGDVFVADVIDGRVKVHRKYIRQQPSQGLPTSQSHDQELTNRITCVDDSLPSESSGSSEESVQEEDGVEKEPDHSSSRESDKGEEEEEVVGRGREPGGREPANGPTGQYTVNAPPPAPVTSLRNKPGERTHPVLQCRL